MEFYLLENGINSLKVGVDFYSKFLDFYFDDTQDKAENHDYDKFSYLKLSVMCIHNSVEILSKKVLSDVNELLIYSDISSKSDLLDYIDIDKTKEVPLHSSLIALESKVHTIEYLESIKRLAKIFNIKSEIVDNLERLGHIRNQITHFGIAKSTDYHTILGVINRSLDFIDEFFLGKHKLFYEFPGQGIFLPYINGLKIEEDLWRSLFDDQFANLVSLIRESIDLVNDEWEDDILSFNVRLNTEINIDTKDKNFYIVTYNYPVVDSTILLKVNPDNDDESEILGIIDYTESEYVYIPKKVQINTGYFSPYKKFWKGDQKNYKKMEITIEVLKDAILKKIITSAN
ncbi:hypothetical protein [Priestia megaterium]|uniref:hypothetical protein n=1 Tax=Priestia megaterium TaxID=1404 RepID=UPI00207A21E0|nr:hypothetical protein [Priestia megaterium]USL28008.1 hypothetical protein LIT33_30315 [Priestia megaterium]